MFVGDFNSKLEVFGCAKKNISGPMLKNIQSHLTLTYLNNDEHTLVDKRTGNTDILDMALQTDREVFESTFEAALSSDVVPEPKYTQDITLLYNRPPESLSSSIFQTPKKFCMPAHI